MYPEYAEINGKTYKIDTSFNTALKCFEVLNDKTIVDEERALAVIYLLFDFIPDDNLEEFLNKAKIYLQCGETIEEQKNKKRDMDFIQDRKYIMSSFMSDYHIDLSKEDIHFWQFIEYIQGLTESSSLNRIRELRNCDTSKIKDLNEKQRIIDAQKEIALKENKPIKKFTEQEQKNIDKFYELTGIERRN